MLAHSYDEQQTAKLGQVLVLLTCLTLTAYFAYHANYGRYGLEARQKLIERSVLLEFEIRSLETTRTKLAHEIELLTKDPPNADLVEEIARSVLGYAKRGDRIVKLH